MTSLYASLDRMRPQFLSILRIVVALLFIQHGTTKFFGFPAAGPASLPPLIIVQGLLEIVGGVLLLVGAYSRIIAFILSGDMAVAYFMSHFPKSFFPMANGGNLAVLYSFVFLYIFFAGGGPWSVDEALLKREQRPEVAPDQLRRSGA